MSDAQRAFARAQQAEVRRQALEAERDAELAEAARLRVEAGHSGPWFSA